MTIRWLHLSDTHFREDELWDRRATLKALITKVRELKANGLAPDMVFVTGDIAWSGKPKEYEQATRFFHELNKVLELDPKDRWFLVPGNHDVDRSRIKAAHRAITASLQDEATVEEVLLRDPDSLRSLSTRLEAYYNFAADFLGPARALQPDRPWRTDVREFDGVSIGILQLNSAWIAEGGKADEANLLVGEAQVREALDATPDAFLRIALMHHPLRNLREFDANRVKARLSKSTGAAFLLRGHLHLNDTESQQSPDGHLLEIAAGTLYTDETNWPRGFHVGEVDFAKGEARIHLFRYSGGGSDFFAPDNLTYENAPTGVCKIKLPAAYRLGGKKAKTAKTISEEQRLSFTSRYRKAAAAYHGHARFIGFPNQAARPNARVSDLFVPLRMKSRDGTFDAASRTTAEIAQALLRPHDDEPTHVVILGDPGSGKTMLSRFLVMLAAGAITMPDVQVAGEPLPLRIAFRDFVERRRVNPNLSLLEYLELQAKAEFSLALPKNFLRKALENGQALLLLDGLDEVGVPEHRTAMRDLVLAFLTEYNRLPVLVTSRIAGYSEAPLGVWRRSEKHMGHVLVIFGTLLLEKFDDADLRTFVAHWYSVQEPADPVARERGIADLVAALDADERVRELARTPILATLIAMIHRVEANLPGERAKLYDLCVRMLLETWPAQAKRPFADIDPGLQRAYLESLAFDMQTRRTKSEAVTIKRGDLVAKLLPILHKRDFASEPSEKVGGVIERWIDHLEKHSGILVEQSTGVYAFFHLSIMEYLAARGMERDVGRDGAVQAIGEHFNDAVWREVCLLSVGSHAEDGDFLDAVYECVGKLRFTKRWDFLFRCLREEPRFRPEQRETILGQYATTLLQHGPGFTDRTLIDQIQRFSIRHGDAVRHWIEQRLDSAVGDELLAMTAIVPDSHVVLDRLANRHERAMGAGALLEFWPGSELGAWAVAEVDAAAALIWSGRTSHDLAPLRGVAALGEPPKPLAAASFIALNRRTLQSCFEAARNLARGRGLPRPGGLGLPPIFSTGPGNGTLITTARSPCEPRSRLFSIPSRFAHELAIGFAGVFAHSLATKVASEFSFDFARDFASVFTRDFARPFSSAQGIDFAGYFFSEFNLAFGSYFDVDFAFQFARSFALSFNIGRDLAAEYAFNLATEFATAFAHDFCRNLKEPPSTTDRSLMLSMRIGTLEEAQCAAQKLLGTMAGEAWIALATTESAREDERLGYLSFRLQNRWLFEIWPAIDQRLPENPSPAHLALYFALGWAQSTTTWAWPDSERWRTLFAAGPGEHWLVRSQWHLCKLTDDPASKEDDAGLRAALRDGHGDESLPGYAARLSEVLGTEA
jgi:predicted MPP superfamily phosphohydrolase